MVTSQLWKMTLSQIQKDLPESEFSSWFSRLTFGEEKDGVLHLYVPTQFIKNWFETNYKEMIENILNEYCDYPISVVFEIKNTSQKEQKLEKIETPITVEPSKPVFTTISTNTEDLIFNPCYTFESFVTGDNSSFAYSACLAIAKNPGSAYNPCLLYGGVGLGKTHLIQSIGNKIKQDNPKLKVAYVTAENFTNEYIQSLNDKNPQSFKNKYRKVSVLLIDDIHFLQNKAGIQNELFNTFNDLYETGRQIVFTCDRPVEELKEISDRLRSRFQRGLNIDLLPPNYETRVAILRKKCNEKGMVFSDEVIDYIAANISSNVRALESCLTKLIAYSELLNKDISLETAKEQLKHIIISNNDTSGISIEIIIKVVSNHFGVTANDIKGNSRNQSIVLPRQIAMYLCRKLTEYSTTEIASEFGGKNHTTVMYNVQKIEAKLKSSEKEINTIIEKLENQIKQESKK